MDNVLNREDTIKTIHEYFWSVIERQPTLTDAKGEVYFTNMRRCNELLVYSKQLSNIVMALPPANEHNDVGSDAVFGAVTKYFCGLIGNSPAGPDEKGRKIYKNMAKVNEWTTHSVMLSDAIKKLAAGSVGSKPQGE